MMSKFRITQNLNEMSFTDGAKAMYFYIILLEIWGNRRTIPIISFKYRIQQSPKLITGQYLGCELQQCGFRVTFDHHDHRFLPVPLLLLVKPYCVFPLTPQRTAVFADSNTLPRFIPPH